MEQSAQLFDTTPILMLAALAVLAVVGAALFLRGRRSGVVSVSARPPAQALPPGTDPELAALLTSGNTIGAIKLVRERTGLGLKEAKDYVEQLRAGQAPATPLAPPPPAPVPGDMRAEVATLLAQDKKIEAIKLVRERTGMGLKEAKDYVDRFQG